jgi:hypothetical protein
MTYHAYSNWGLDRRSGALLVTIHDMAGGLRLYTSDDWTQSAIVLAATTLPGRTATADRFVYHRSSTNAFDFEYQVTTDSGAWKMVDHLDCQRVN